MADIIIAVNSVLFDNDMGKDLINSILEKEFGLTAAWCRKPGDTYSPSPCYLSNPNFFVVDIESLTQEDCYDYFSALFKDFRTKNDEYEEFLETSPIADFDFKKLAARYQELYYSLPETNGMRRRLLDALSEGRNLYAIWSTLDGDVKKKLERSGLISYFKKCFVCSSFERDFGDKIMSKKYFEDVVRKEIDACSGASYAPIYLISDYRGFYKKGSYRNTIYYDPDSMIKWELDSGYVVKDYEEILQIIKPVKSS